MFDDAEVLAPLTHSFKIAGETFTLREMTGPDLQRYARMLTAGAAAVSQAVRALIRPSDPIAAVAAVRGALEGEAEDDAGRLAAVLDAVRPTGLSAGSLGEAVEQAVGASMDEHTEVLCWLLGRERGWVTEHVTGSMRRRILAEQDRLNGMDELSKNVRPLLLAAV